MRRGRGSDGKEGKAHSLDSLLEVVKELQEGEKKKLNRLRPRRERRDSETETNLIQSEAVKMNGHDLLDARPSDLDRLLQAFQDSFRITEDLLKDEKKGKKEESLARRSEEGNRVEELRRKRDRRDETRRLTLSFLPFLPGTSSCHQR